MAANLGFLIKTIFAYFIATSHGCHLGFLTGIILAILYLQLASYFLPSFESVGLSIQEKKSKIDFQDGVQGSHLGFQIRMICQFWSKTSRKHAYIILSPLKPHFYIVKLGFTEVYIIFLISAQKHRLWVLLRTASARRF